MMYRAYSVLSIKEYKDEGEYFEFSGIATTPTPDRYGDIVEPKGGTFKNPMPLLWQHRSDTPVGNVEFSDVSDDGINFKAKLPYIKEDGKLKEEVDKAIQSVKYGLVSAVSIGFKTKEYSYINDSYGMHITEWECLELSLVTIPANSDAIITEIKSIDQQHRAIPIKAVHKEKSVGVSATKKIVQIKQV